MVDRIRSEKPEMDSIFLNAGDYYQVHTQEKRKDKQITDKQKRYNTVFRYIEKNVSYIPVLSKRYLDLDTFLDYLVDVSRM